MSSKKCDLRFWSILSYVPLRHLEDATPDATDLPKKDRAREGCAKLGIEDKLCEKMLLGHNLMVWLKNNIMVQNYLRKDHKEVEMSELVAHLTKVVLAEELEANRNTEFHELLGEFLKGDSLLVPVPPHFQMESNSTSGRLWVPDRIAAHMEELGLGRRLVALRREREVPKSSTLLKRTERHPVTHYDSLEIASNEDLNGKRVVLIDDIVTTGSTMLGSAWRILNRYPDAQIVGFAAMRTVSDPRKFRGSLDPVAGCIVHNEDCTTSRWP